MKKIFTLLFTTVLLTTAFAQYNPNDQWDKNKDRDVARNDDRFKNGGGNKDDHLFNDNYFFKKREMNMQIDRINREYDYRIQSVKDNFFMSRNRKMRKIQWLQDQRDEEIRMVYIKFKDRNNRYDDHNFDPRHY